MVTTDITSKTRCFSHGKDFYALYHDDQRLFEMLILEGAQAGLSWETVLKKREGYQQAFYHFDVQKVATMTDEQLEQQLNNPAIIRNRLKIYSARKNAQVFITIQQECGSFSQYLWAFVNHVPIINHRQSFDEMPVRTPISDAISKDLKKRGMSFVGSTIIYAYMQAVGLVNDHLKTCWLYHRDR